MSYKTGKIQSRKIFQIILVALLFISFSVVTLKATGILSDKIPKKAIETFEKWNENPGLGVVVLETCKSKTKTMYIVTHQDMNSLSFSGRIAYLTEDGESLPTKPGEKLENKLETRPVPVDDTWNPKLFKCKATPLSD